MPTLIRTPQELLAEKLSKESLATLEKVHEHFSISLTSAVRETIQAIDDPVALQYVPRIEELNIQNFEQEDPISDEKYTPTEGVVHRYPDRCLLKISNVCPVYCRFCFRKEKIGPGSKALGPQAREAAYHYIANHPEIWEVILTGGDPLILNPNLLRGVIESLSHIPHVRVIRIHTRVPVTDPSRITAELLEALETEKMLIIGLHANHPQEFSPSAKAALKKIRLAGIPLVSQSVLLKGINDDAETLMLLMRTFMENGVKPYYLHHLDPARGTSHFHVPIHQGQALMEQLRGRLSGLCQPLYVIDIPGGFGKSPLTPNYLNPEKTEIMDFRGNKHGIKS
jgi:lysine 2,3-aminomutase